MKLSRAYSFKSSKTLRQANYIEKKASDEPPSVPRASEKAKSAERVSRSESSPIGYEAFTTLLPSDLSSPLLRISCSSPKAPVYSQRTALQKQSQRQRRVACFFSQALSTQRAFRGPDGQPV